MADAVGEGNEAITVAVVARVGCERLLRPQCSTCSHIRAISDRQSLSCQPHPGPVFFTAKEECVTTMFTSNLSRVANLCVPALSFDPAS